MEKGFRHVQGDFRLDAIDLISVGKEFGQHLERLNFAEKVRETVKPPLL